MRLFSRKTSASRKRRRAAAPIEALERRTLLNAIASDQTLTGSISIAGEIDEYTFDASVGDSIIGFVAETTTAAFDPAIQLIAPDATPLVSDFGEVGADIYFTSLPQTGTYTLRVYDNGHNDTGDYAVTLAKLPGLQAPGADGGLLLSGPRTLGTIDVGDLDVYTFHMNSGDNVILSIAEPNGNTGFEPQMFLYGPNGAHLVNDYGDVGADMYHTASSSGTYYLVVKDWISEFTDDRDVDTGDYALTMALLPGPQLHDGGDGGTITSGQRRSGMIEIGDLDVYTFQMNAGDNVILSIAEPNGNTGFEPQMFLYGPNGAHLVNDYGDVGADMYHTAASSGTYYVVIKDWVSEFSDDRDIDAGEYHFTIAHLPGNQTDAGSDGGPLTSGPRRVGTIDYGDLDIYTIQANAGDRLIFSIAEVYGDTGFEPQMFLYGPDGAHLGNDYGNVGADLYHTATSSGTHYLVVKDWISEFSDDRDVDAGEYVLRMAKLPDIHVDDDGEGGPMTSGQRVNGAITLGDLDVYTMSLDVGDSMIGVVRSLEQAAWEAHVLLYSPSGVLIDSGNGSNDFVVAAGNVAAAGTYYVVVKDFISEFTDDRDVEAGDYALTFVKTPGPQPSDADSGPLVSGVPRAGAVSVGDMDVYTFPVTAGQGFTINLAETAALGFDPAFTLYNPSGAPVTTQSGATNASVTVSNANAVTGTYTLVVYDAGGDESGPYSVALDTAVGTDDLAPRITEVQYRYDVAPPDLRVIFSENVAASATLSDVEIINRDTNQPVSHAGLSFVYEAANDLFKVTFPAFPGRVLPDGNYRLRLDRNNITDTAGNALDQDLEFDFFVLAGDANRDRVVNLQDFNRLASNFGRSPRLFSHGDFNYDGSITLQDFNILASQFGKTLPEPVAAMRPIAAAGRFGDSRIGTVPGDDADDSVAGLIR